MLHRCQSRELKQDADMNPTEQSVIDSVKTYLGPKLPGDMIFWPDKGSDVLC